MLAADDDDAQLVGSSDAAAGGSSSADASLPNATVARLVKEVLPDGLRVAPDVVPLLQVCLGEFLAMVATQANGLAKQACKDKATVVIGEKHVETALGQLGLGHYCAASDAAPAAAGNSGDAAASGAPAAEPKKRKRGKGKSLGPPGVSEEELLRMQLELFESAKRHVAAAQGLDAAGGDGDGGAAGGAAPGS